MNDPLYIMKRKFFYEMSPLGATNYIRRSIVATVCGQIRTFEYEKI